MNVKLGEDIGNVPVSRTMANEERFSNFSISPAHHQQLQHFLLARGQVDDIRRINV